MHAETRTPLNAKMCVAVREWIVDVIDKAKQQGMPGLKLQLGFECNVSTSTLKSSNIEIDHLSGWISTISFSAVQQCDKTRCSTFFQTFSLLSTI